MNRALSIVSSIVRSVQYSKESANAFVDAYHSIHGKDKYVDKITNDFTENGGFFPIDCFGSAWHCDVPIYVRWAEENGKCISEIFVKLLSQDDRVWRECMHVSEDIRHYGEVVDFKWVDMNLCAI